MSESKFIMAKKLANIQVRLMEGNIEESDYDSLLPIIFSECVKEKLTFWFNFMEDAAVLNLRDVEHENYELNIRLAYPNVPSEEPYFSNCKEFLLKNTFLIVPGAHEKIHVNQDILDHHENEKPISQTNGVPPRAVRAAMDVIISRGEEPTKNLIEKELQLDKMSIDNRKRCIAFLRSMEE